jgi:hypothetical protein
VRARAHVRSSCNADIFNKLPAKCNFIYINLLEKHTQMQKKKRKKKKTKAQQQGSARTAQNIRRENTAAQKLLPASWKPSLGLE